MVVNHSALTLEQIHEIAGLGTPKKPHNHILSGALQPLLQVLSPKWVRDFVFSPAPLHLPHLSSPTLATTATTCAITWIGIMPHAPPPNAMPYLDESYHYNGNILFVPAFTADSTTVGVGVFHAVGSTLVPWCERSDEAGELKFNLRFALDTKTHTMALIMDVVDDDRFYVYCEMPTSSTENCVFSGFFSSSLRDEALREGNELRLEHVLPMLLLAQDEIHQHACSVCRAQPGTGCGCQLSFSLSANPFDREHFLNSMSIHCSEAQGMGNQISYDSGAPQSQVVLGSRTSLQGIIDLDVLQRLSKWSLSDHMKRINSDPLQSLVVNGTMSDDFISMDDSDPRFGMELELFPTNSRKAPMLDMVDDTSLQSLVPTASILDEQDVPEVETLSSGDSFLTCKWFEGPQVSLPEPSASCSDESQQTALPYAANAVDQPEQIEEIELDDLEPLDAPEALTTQPSSSGTPVTPVVGTPVSGPSDSGLPLSGPPVSRPPLSGPSISTAPVSVPPMSGPPAGGTPVWILPETRTKIVFDDTESPSELVRRMKEEEKKERNRASARRSNQRKKVYREKLKSDLASNHELIGSLRKREMLLREENRRLRNSYFGGNVK